MRFLAFALAPPQPREAGGRAQLPGFGALEAGNIDGVQETRLRLPLHSRLGIESQGGGGSWCLCFSPVVRCLLPVAFLHEHEFSLKPIEFRLAGTLPSFVY